MPAAYAHKFAKVTISGECLGGSEIWTTGFAMGSPTVDISGVNAPGAENIAAAWKTFFELSTNNFSSNYKTLQVKVAGINTDGTTDLDEIDYYDYPTAVAGGGNGTVLPPQITLAATLTSDNQRGLASKGRMYLPGINAGIDGTSGKISGAIMGNLADSFKTFLDAVNTAGGTSGKIILASKGRKVPGPVPNDYLGGVSAWVTGCRIGDVYDTQRRRRNALNESYTPRVLA